MRDENDVDINDINDHERDDANERDDARAAAQQTAGVLLAAGRGRRMGRLKQLLPWGASTLVATSFDALAAHCGAGVVVVLGAETERVRAALRPRAFREIESEPDAEQLESVRRGLSQALEWVGASVILVHPADHPIIPEDVVVAIASQCEATGRVQIPTFDGRGGHPVAIPRDIAESIVEWRGRTRNTPAVCAQATNSQDDAPAGGLRTFWEHHADRVDRIPFDKAVARGIRLDLDTPDDLERARREFERADASS